MKQIFRNRVFLSAALGHSSIDIFNSSAPVLIAFLSAPALMNLSNAQVGLAASLYAFLGAIGQPVFGWLADRYGSRWLAGTSVAWTVGFLVLATLAAQSNVFVLMLIPFSLAAIGSAAFHPVGTMNASVQITHRAATATALFFLFGQFGLASGPVITGFLLQSVGLGGLQLLALVVAPVVVFMWLTPYPKPAPRPQPTGAGDDGIAWQEIAWGAVSILILVTICRSWAQIGTVNFTPKLFQDKGWEPTAYGAVTGAMWLASAITGVVAGELADRFGRRKIIFWSMLMAAPPLFLLPLSDGWLAFVIALLVGGLTGAPHSIIVVIIQDLLPGRKALASGLALGFIFSMGSFATYSIGLIGDWISLPFAIQIGSGLSLLGAALALALPQTRAETSQPETLEAEII